MQSILSALPKGTLTDPVKMLFVEVAALVVFQKPVAVLYPQTLTNCFTLQFEQMWVSLGGRDTEKGPDRSQRANHRDVQNKSDSSVDPQLFPESITFS